MFSLFFNQEFEKKILKEAKSLADESGDLFFQIKIDLLVRANLRVRRTVKVTFCLVRHTDLYLHSNLSTPK